MTSPQNSFSLSNWKPYPTEVEWLSGIRLIIPAESGIYGMPGNQIAITSNHQPSLVRLGKMEEMTTFALDGGGFPVEVAAAFDLLQAPQGDFISEYIESVGGNVTFYVPHSLAIAWNWLDGEMRMGATVKVVANTFSDTGALQSTNIYPIIIRLYTAVRLALAQILLMAIPIAIINLAALVPIALILFLGSCLLAGIWSQIPGTGWSKGMVIGFVCVGIMALLAVFQFFSFPPLSFVGGFIAIYWLGGLFMGARSAI